MRGRVISDSIKRQAFSNENSRYITNWLSESESIFSEMLEPFVMLLTWNKEKEES